MNCQKCNTLNADDLTFCTNCGFQFKELESKNSKNLLIAAGAVLIGVIGCCGVFGLMSIFNKKDQPVVVVSPAGTPASNSVVPPAGPGSGITWKDYNNAFSPKNNLSDQQKDLLWKNFAGKTVSWEGMVSDFDADTPDLKVKMNAETLSFDIALNLRPDQKSKLAGLSKGDIVRFSGRLKTYGGKILPLMMDDGVIR